MKKSLFFSALSGALFITFFSTLFSAQFSFAEVPDTSDWYQYNSYANTHSFAIKYPPEFLVKTIDDELQGFFEKEKYEEDPVFFVREFNDAGYDQAIDYYKDSSVSLLKSQDFLFKSSTEDLTAKQVFYSNKESNMDFSVTFIKRGNVVVALEKRSDKNTEIIDAIHESFKFTDGWHQYIDFSAKYSFIFPTEFTVKNVDSGVEIIANNSAKEIVFKAEKFDNTEISNAPKKAEISSENLVDQKNINFYGDDGAIEASYLDTVTNKNFSKIFLERNGDSYSFTNINIEDDFPHSNYFDEYVFEMLQSLEFFSSLVDIEEDYSTFTFFPDVRDNHVNANSINTLYKNKVINGYPDGTFKPDGEINRAELTKMIVITKIKPDSSKYNNCFTDVKKEWFAPYICYAKEKGWVQGYKDGKFKPESNISRVEAIKIILEVLFSAKIDSREKLMDKTVLDVELDEWYGKYFIFADNRKLLDKQHIEKSTTGYSYFPNKNITRKEVAELIYRATKK